LKYSRQKRSVPRKAITNESTFSLGKKSKREYEKKRRKQEGK